MDEAGIEQLADHESHSAGSVELVHVGFAVGINSSEEWYDRRQLVEVVPIDQNTRRVCHRDEADGVVG